MPIYEYHCDACGHEFEVMQKVNDPPVHKCEKCGKKKARKMISHTSFVLNGSGWYVTDYGGKKPSSSEHRSSESDGKSSEKTPSKKETPSPAKESKGESLPKAVNG